MNTQRSSLLSGTASTTFRRISLAAGLLSTLTCLLIQPARADEAEAEKPTVQQQLFFSATASGDRPQTNEPYSWEAQDGTVLSSGATDKKGLATVIPRAGENIYFLTTVGKRNRYLVDESCWSLPANDFSKCMQLLDSEDLWKKRDEKEQQELDDARQAADKAARDRYEKEAAANDDELAWLGPLPPKWNPDALRKAYSELFRSLESGLMNPEPQFTDFKNFVCKSPAELGSTPKYSAVDAYMPKIYPVRRYLNNRDELGPADLNSEDAAEFIMSQKIWADLVEAASLGNKMARFQIYLLLGDTNNVSYVQTYRRLQLGQGLAEAKFGALYAYFISQLRATGLPSSNDMPDMIAGMYGSYSAMKRIGELYGNDYPYDPDETDHDEELKRLAKKMGACAREMMPVLFEE